VPLDYNLLLGHNWTYTMIAIVSSVFDTLCFPHDGKIVTINQLSFVYTSPNAYIGPFLVKSLLYGLSFYRPRVHVFQVSSKACKTIGPPGESEGNTTHRMHCAVSPDIDLMGGCKTQVFIA
jgi:hypothetical protein